TAALVDGTLLLDCGPETPQAAQRAGVDLTALRHVLLTHVHPDHCAPAFLLYRSWVADAPLDVLGPPEVVAQARMWLAPDQDGVRFVEVAPGDRHRPGAYDVRVLAARHGAPGSAVLYDVTGPSGRLLHATDTGPLDDETVAAVAGAAYDVVLLEETFGDHTSHGTDHLDLGTFPDQLRRLRAVGAVTPATDVVAVHLSHRNPPAAELGRRLGAWGARVVDDGTTLGAKATPVPRGRTLVLGGARSGKSTCAESLLAAEDDVTYVATAYPADHDDEWSERVRRHRAQRPGHWRTVETLDLAALLSTDGGPLLVDCLTLWLTRVLDRHGGWDDETWAGTAEKAVAAEIDELVAAWRGTSRRVVAVSNEVGQGVVPASASGRRFRDLMGRLNARVAAESEDVLWCTAGRVTRL
ncbi:MAG: bifunctional adenosylcobinamide kinase/adenosylcobinamide-phosphate guanylyltransferase, partial [Nocardioidaceae bacterium]|nr:bifunctional adenosylcobinamide kinase/adenosylcobinamide-phosphate guanylyltransferase [Nocardioidaceae bacterium]